MRNAFPTKFAPRRSEQPIRGDLSSVIVDDEQRHLINRITVGLFLDLQNKPLADILAACYITGANHAIGALSDD